jgi:hypothetical protein
MELDKNTSVLVNELVSLIETGRKQVAYAANASITLTYWQLGNRINSEILDNKRADYGKQIVESVSLQLIAQYGNNYGVKNLRRMMQFAQVFDDERIVVSAIRQLSWTHFIALIPLKNPLQRDFYTQMCQIEGWSIKILRQKIDGMLFERTAISKKPDDLIKQELEALRETN